MSRARKTLPAIGRRAVSVQSGDDKSLEAIRTHLGMQILCLGIFGRMLGFSRGGCARFRRRDQAGDSQPLDDIFCRHILAGRLPEVMPDVSKEPLACSLPIMKKVPIGSHISVPIRLPDGETYGMFCCLSLRRNRR